MAIQGARALVVLLVASCLLAVTDARQLKQVMMQQQPGMVMQQQPGMMQAGMQAGGMMPQQQAGMMPQAAGGAGAVLQAAEGAMAGGAMATTMGGQQVGMMGQEGAAQEGGAMAMGNDMTNDPGLIQEIEGGGMYGQRRVKSRLEHVQDMLHPKHLHKHAKRLHQRNPDLIYVVFIGILILLAILAFVKKSINHIKADALKKNVLLDVLREESSRANERADKTTADARAELENLKAEAERLKEEIRDKDTTLGDKIKSREESLSEERNQSAEVLRKMQASMRTLKEKIEGGSTSAWNRGKDE